MLEIYPDKAGITTARGRFQSRRNVGKRKKNESYAQFKRRMKEKHPDEPVVEYREVEPNYFKPFYE